MPSQQTPALQHLVLMGIASGEFLHSYQARFKVFNWKGIRQPSRSLEI